MLGYLCLHANICFLIKFYSFSLHGGKLCRLEYVSINKTKLNLIQDRESGVTMIGSKQNQIRLKSENSRSKKRSDDIDIMPAR